MNEIAAVYTERWFRDRVRYRPVYLAFARAIEETWHPFRLLDLGCGAGYVLEHFVGRVPVMGVEGASSARLVQDPRVASRVLVADLTGPPRDVASTFEFVVSIEVAEHLPAESADAYLAWFRGARRVFFTAAPPGQGGNHHVNEQPPRYWIDKFAALGLNHRPDETLRWRARAGELTKGCPWVRKNAMFFSRGQAAEEKVA